MNTTPKEQTISKGTRMTVGVVLGIIALIGPGVWEWSDIRGQISQLRRDQWSVNSQLRWASEFQKLNPSINVPIPTEPSQNAIIIHSNAVMAAAVTRGKQ